MKFFHIDQGIISPGVEINHELQTPSVVFDGYSIPLSEYYFKSGSNPDRVMAADLELERDGSYSLDPESACSSSDALVFIRTKQTTAALHITVDGMLGHKQNLYHKRRVQAGLKLQRDYVEFSTTFAVVRLHPGQELTVHLVFTKRKVLPPARSLKEVLSRLCEGPQYEYEDRVEESYIFDGTKITSTK